MHVFAVRLRQDRQAAHSLTVQHNIAEIDFTIDDWRILGAGAGQMKAGLPLDRETWQIKTLEVGKLNIGASEIETIIFVAKVVSQQSGKARAIVRQLDIFQPRFASVQAQVAGKGLERFAINRQLGDL